MVKTWRTHRMCAKGDLRRALLLRRLRVKTARGAKVKKDTTVANILMGTARYEAAIKRDATSGALFSLTLRPLDPTGGPPNSFVAYPLPQLDIRGDGPTPLSCTTVIDIPIFLTVTEAVA